MAFRFRKSIKLAPGVRVNVGKRGASFSVGPRGATVSVGSRGTYVNTGIPGTGTSFRNKIGGEAQSNRNKVAVSSNEKVSVVVKLDEEGNVEFYDQNDSLLSDSLIRIVKKQQGDAIREWLAAECEKYNKTIELIESIYLDTQSPNKTPIYNIQSFNVSVPNKPTLKGLGILGRIFASKRAQIEKQNKEKVHLYEKELKSWREEKHIFEMEQNSLKKLIEKDVYTDTDAIQKVFEYFLNKIEWPRETNISFEIVDNGKAIYLDVDLPEIEDLPTKIATLPAKSYKLNIKNISDTALRKMYMKHIHGIGFRLAGEVFSNLPTIDKVILSAYSQRPNKATGNIEDEYLYSAIIDRTNWETINFKNLENLDVIESFSMFENRRKMTQTGVFKPIEPYEIAL